MKFRLVNRQSIRTVQALVASGWVDLDKVPRLTALAADFGVTGPIASNLMATLLLCERGMRELQAELSGVDLPQKETSAVCLPFEPKSFRDFMLYEDHVIDSTRAYVKRFLPALYPLTQAFEAVTRKPFPRFRPHRLWYQQPIYYLSNHLNFYTTGDDVQWPAYTKAMDYELELGAVITKPLFNASTEEAEKAIGGFVVLNDFSARDVQKEEMDSGFGPQKAKHFASAMSATVASADEILPLLNILKGSVSINGKKLAICSALEPRFTLAEAIAFASKDEQLHPGELFGSGTLPGGSGLENGHWLKPGDTLTLEIDPIGVIENTIQGAR